MRFNGWSDEESCGKRVPGELSDKYDDLGGVACMRTALHDGDCIPVARDAGEADGVHWCCRTRLDADHHAQCPVVGKVP